MISTLHGQTTLYCNINTDIRIAKETGYQAIELHTDKLWRYLAAGYSAEDLKTTLAAHGIQPACIDIIGSVERHRTDERNALMEEAQQLCDLAAGIDCPTIQLNAFNGLADRSWDEMIRITAANIAEIADMGREKGIRFQIEGAAWTPVHSLNQCLELMAAVDRDNVGLVIDTWHLWAVGDTDPFEVAALDPNLIYGVHLADGRRLPEDGSDIDESQLRGYLPGDGDLPLAEWVAAIRSTGFDGMVSGEILNHRLWEQDLFDIATDMRQRMEKIWNHPAQSP